MYELLGFGSVDWDRTLAHMVIMLAAFVMALPIGWNREESGRSLGLRTFPLVAVAAASYIMIGREAFGDKPDAQARLLQGLITGIGFLGGGAIVKHGTDVRGTSTAASIWTTAAIGASLAYRHWGLAILLMLINVITFFGLTWVKKNVLHTGEEEEGGVCDDEDDEEVVS